ncbi:MAG: hypothetical protein K8U57_22680 [Planctomycetes bacterium]|nr:hypothetical protein [Planctomycetota bacterium]
MHVRSSCSTSIITLVCLVTSGDRIRAEEPVNNPKQTSIVLRISKDFIGQDRLPTIEKNSPIDLCLFGSHVTGTAHTVGQTSFTLEPSETDAVFTARFKGTTDSKQVATHRPVVVRGSGKTDFDVWRAIRFDGVHFVAEPVTIDGRTSSTIESVETPPRLIGRVVRRVALQRIDQTKSQGDAITLRDVKAQVLSGFASETDRLVKQLNRLVPYEKMIAVFAPKANDWTAHLRTTEQYLIISPGPKDAAVASLPEEAQQMQAPLELWIRGESDSEWARQLIKNWSKADHTLDQFREGLTGKKQKTKGVTFTAVGDWWVVKVGDDVFDQWFDKIEGKPK